MLEENQIKSINMQIQLTIVTSIILINALHSVRGEKDRQYVSDFQVSDYDFMNEVFKFITNDKLNENELFLGDDTSSQPEHIQPSLRNPTKNRKGNLQIGDPNAISSVESNDQTSSENHAGKPSIIEDGHVSTSLPNTKSDIKMYPKPAKEDSKQSLDNKSLKNTQKNHPDNQSHFNASKERLDQSNDGRTKKLILLPNQMVSKVNDEFHNLFTDKTHKLFKSKSPTQESENSNGKSLQSNKGILGNTTNKSGDVQTEFAQPSYTYIRNDYMFDQPQTSDGTKHLLDMFVGMTCALICIFVHI